jgi:putative oxidoreductase
LTSSFQDDLVNRYTDTVYCIIRVVVGLMFACHGGQKILGFPPSERGLATNPLGVTVGWIELSCGFLVAFGLLTRPAAFTASGEMAVAYFLTSFSGKTLDHAPNVLERLLPILNKGELPVLFCFMFFLVVFYGPGRWSIDSLLKGKLRSAATS